MATDLCILVELVIIVILIFYYRTDDEKCLFNIKSLLLNCYSFSILVFVTSFVQQTSFETCSIMFEYNKRWSSEMPVAIPFSWNKCHNVPCKQDNKSYKRVKQHEIQRWHVTINQPKWSRGNGIYIITCQSHLRLLNYISIIARRCRSLAKGCSEEEEESGGNGVYIITCQSYLQLLNYISITAMCGRSLPKGRIIDNILRNWENCTE